MEHVPGTPMANVINVILIIVSLTLIAILLLQIKGEGLGGAFGSDNPVQHQRRGLEATLFNLTIVLSAVFLILSLVAALAPRLFQ
jgi:preprotein translocase subunit SecG